MLRSSVALLVFALLPVAGGPPPADRRPISETDLFNFTWIADPEISPDGSTVAFVRVVADAKRTGYESSIFVVPASGAEAPRRLTSGTHDTAPRWSPDGRELAFVRAIERDGKTQPAQIYLLRTDGGEARALTDLPRGAGAPVWSPDGRTVAFSSSTRADDFTAPPAPKDEHKSDVKVITSAVYRSNGNPGWVDGDRHTHVWTVSVTPAGDAAKAHQVTDGDFDERGAAWSPDGSTIYFTSTRVKDAYFEAADSDLYRVPAAGGEIVRISSIEGTIGNVSVSPDGRRVAFVGTLHGDPVRSYSQPDLWVADAAPGAAPTNLTSAYDFDINGGIGGDQVAPRGDEPKPIVWTAGGTALVVVAAEHGSANLKRVVIASGKVEPLTEGKLNVVAYTATPDGSKIAATLSTQTNVGDISIVAVSGAVATPAGITDVNAELFEGITQSEPEEIWYRSFDGRNIQGWILKPPDFDPSKKYPLILADSRRAALGLRQHLHARVHVDGGEGLRGAVHEPARQHELRTGVRQPHSVPLSRRRLQGSDGGCR